MFFVGFDPGGAKALAWAVLEASDSTAVRLRTGLAADPAEAMLDLAKVLQGQAPAGVGIDAPLVWSQGRERVVDRALRVHVRAARGKPSTVMHINSLKGACVAQGVILAQLCTARWPEALLTECHPKVLAPLPAWLQSVGLRPELVGRSDHERDAALCAGAAWAAVCRAPDWHDIRAIEDASITVTPGRYLASYWMPLNPDALLDALEQDSKRRRRNRAGHAAATQARTLDELLAVYRKHFAKGRTMELAHYAPASGISFDGALRHAALARVPKSDGITQRHGHQARLRDEDLAEGHAQMLQRADHLRAAKDFDALHKETLRIANKTPGIGETWAFDAAFRLGIFLNQLPTDIPLHAGCREGAERLFGSGTYGPIPMDRFGRLGKELDPAYLEGFLCDMKDYLHPSLLLE